MLKFFGLFGFSLLFVSFRSVSPRIVCLPVYLLAYLLILHHSQSHVSAAAAERERDGRERGEGEHELLLVSSHCVKFLASTSFGILCQGHSTNSLDLTNIENICVFARDPLVPSSCSSCHPWLALGVTNKPTSDLYSAPLLLFHRLSCHILAYRLALILNSICS